MRIKNILTCVLSIFVSLSAYSAEDNEIQKVTGRALSSVELSNRSVNDVLCQGGSAIDHFVNEGVPVVITKLPNSKGWIVTFQYLVNEHNPMQKQWYSEKSEIMFVCSTGMYKVQVSPVYEASKTLILSDGGEGKIKKNLELIKSKDIEEVAVEFALKIINDNGSGINLPDSYTIKPSGKKTHKYFKGIVDGVAIRPERSIKIDGIGLRANEYTVKAQRNIQLKHVNFLTTPLGGNIFTVTLEDESLIKGQKTTVVITHLERGI